MTIGESGKTHNKKLLDGFYETYMSGDGVEVGYGGAEFKTVLPWSKGYDKGTPGYDGIHLPLGDASQDYLYSSHCLEHIEDYQAALTEWMRVLKPHGHLIIVVPHRDLYEKRLTLPSRFNADHKRFYTPASLLQEVERSLPTNSHRVRHLRDNDEGHEYNDSPEVHGRWLYEIEMVLEKL